MKTWIVLIVASSLILSITAVAAVLKLAHAKHWYDKIDERKIHTGLIPRLGGLGFAPAYFIMVLLVALVSPEDLHKPRLVSVFSGMVLITIFGVIDDFNPLRPRLKLFLQCISALLVLIPGFTFHRFFHLDLLTIGELNWIRYPITALWIIGLINAMNFIDGIDGLAGGLSALIVISYVAIFALGEQAQSIMVLTVCLFMVICGFLVFNLPVPKAKIFMGDGGSQFLGFMLAVLPTLNRGKPGTAIPLFHAAALLLIPILDTTAAVWRRLRDKKPIDSPDKSHIHHKLMNLGLMSRGIDGILYSLQIILGILVYISLQKPLALSMLFLGIAYLCGLSFFIAIHFMNQAVLRKRPTS